MSNDRELLELAAKAAGYAIESYERDGGAWVYPQDAPKNEDGEPPIFKWNPSDDDGDALRLAVKLGMIVSIINHPDLLQVEATAYPPDKRPKGRMATESLGTEHYAATRRAIVRAAAEIGRQM